MVKVDFGGSFDRDYHDLIGLVPNLWEIVFQKIDWFKRNPADTRLDNHALTKRMKGKWAFSITDNIRIVYERTSKTTVRFLAIGPHSKVYRKSH